MKGIWEEILGREPKAKDRPDTSELEIGIDQILRMKLSDLSRQSIALKIYSEVLGCEIWLCSNKEIVVQLRQDDPETTIYTANEMRRIMSLKPDPKELMNFHSAKSVFPGSRVVDCRLKTRTNNFTKQIK